MNQQQTPQPSQQKISSIKIKKLKNIKSLDLSLLPHNVTAILGPNKSGKSTILHALAACFSPITTDRPGYKFSYFFLPHPHAQWQGSSLEITHSYRIGSRVSTNEVQLYLKNTSRWTPRHERKPKRYVDYFGVDECVPLIEKENREYKINYETTQRSGAIIPLIISKASHILNAQYTTINQHATAGGKTFIGVSSGTDAYTALSMSAGEQKVFKILERVFTAPKYALILIDEIDLLLHDAALGKLIDVLVDRATSESLQIIFTTHRESILKKANTINIRHILTTTTQSFCFEETKPDAIWRLTEEPSRPISIFVEDDLSGAIVRKICAQLQISKYVEISRYGAASNCFAVAVGLFIRQGNLNNSLFVLDGDVYRESSEKQDAIKRVLTGNEPMADTRRGIILSSIVEFNVPINTSPEQFIHEKISNHPTGQSATEHDEIINIAQSIQAVAERHAYLDKIIEQLDLDRSIGLEKIISVFSLTQEWANYSAPIRDWLSSKVPLLRES